MDENNSEGTPARKKGLTDSIIVRTLLALLALHIPIVQLASVLLAAPLLLLFPDLNQTGAHVDVSFAYFKLKSSFAYSAFLIYFLVLFFTIDLFNKHFRS